MSRKRTFASICSDLNSLGMEVLSPESEYFHTKTKITVRGQCGHEWQQSYNNLFSHKSSCPHCDMEDRKWRISLGPDGHENAMKAKGFKLVEWIGSGRNNRSRCIIECSEGHNFEAIPNSVANGRGCPTCAGVTFDPNKPAFLYILSNNEKSLMKVGITNEIRQRLYFVNNDTKMDFDCHFEIMVMGSIARKAEKRLKAIFNRANVGKVPGYTEIFHFDASSPQIAWETVMMYD